MGDTFQQSFRVMAVPGPPEPPVNSADALEIDDPFEALAGVLNQLGGWATEWASILRVNKDWTAAEVREAINADELFTVDEGRFDELDTISTVLSEHGFSWYGVVHPKYEYPGDYHAYTPELGAFQGTCDDDGNVYVTADSLMTMIEEAADLDGLREAVARHTGKAWEDAFAALRQAAMVDAVP